MRTVMLAAADKHGVGIVVNRHYLAARLEIRLLVSNDE